MKQLKISLSDELRARLETISAAGDRSVAEEIRQRLERTIEEDADPETRKLMAAIDKLAVLVRLQTNHLNWHSHAGAHAVFRHAIAARLARLKPDGEAEFGPDDLPRPAARFVPSDDLPAMGLGLEAIEFHTPPLTEERRRKIEEAYGALRQELSEKTVPPIRRRKATGGKS